MPDTSGDTSPRPTFDSLPPEAWTEPDAAADSPPALDPPPTDTPTVSPPVEATLPPATDQQAGEAPQDSGPIPLDRHKAIIEAVRKERDAENAKYERVAFAEEFVNAGKSANDIKEAMSLYDAFKGDPPGLLAYLYDKLDEHPQFAPQVRSWAGKMLSGGRKTIEAVDPQGDPEPQPDFQQVDPTTGNLSHHWSTERAKQWYAWRERQFEAKMDERYKPLVEAHKQTQAAEQQRQSDARDTQRAIAEVDKIKTKPYYDELKSDIAARMKESGWTESPTEAYVHVLTTKKLPTLTADGKAQALAELKTHAAASSAKPSAAASATPTRPKSFHDASLKW